MAKLENTQVGPFLIVKRLGRSRNGVYHAIQTEQNRDVALKFLPIPKQMDWETALQKIQVEVRELQKLRHPNLVKVYGAGADAGKVFLASALIQGESLAVLLSRRGRLTPDLVVEFGRQISDALSCLHDRGLIHGAVKPGNILVTAGEKVKLAGLRFNQPSRRRWDETKHRDLDSAAYLAPEQFTQGACAKSDVYALGVILFEMLTGKLPYELDTLGRLAKRKKTQAAPSVSQHIMNCPVWLDALVTRMLHPGEKQRPYSAREVALAFEEIKKNDASGKTVAAQIGGTFNPLNQGIDKTSAKNLLETEAGDSISMSGIFQTVPFLLLALASIVGLAIWLAMPPSREALIAKTQRQVQSDLPGQWREASVLLKPLMASDDPLAGQAETIYYQARQKMLVDLARRGVSNSILQSTEVQKFTAAFDSESAGDTETAKVEYLRLTQSVDPNGDQRHVFMEAKKRFNELSQKIRLPDSPDELLQWVVNAGKARTLEELELAERCLAAIFVNSSGDANLSKVVQAAGHQLKVVQRRKEAVVNYNQIQSREDSQTLDSVGD
jgi:serine/threonine protein kinase